MAAATALSMTASGVALADNIQDDIVDVTSSVTLVAGSATGGSAKIRVVANNSDGATTDPQCNWDTGEAPLVLNVVTPAGVTANPDPLSITTCGQDNTVTFTADATAVSGTVTVSIVSSPAGGGGYNNQVSIPITVTRPNTKPALSISGVSNGATYVIGSVPTATCDVTDPEDGSSSFAATLSGTLTGGLGSQTATCDYTDGDGLAADTRTATYSIVAPPNTAPVVSVTGVDAATYEIGSEPAAGCLVVDAEQPTATSTPTVDRSQLANGLGIVTVTCSFTDEGNLTDTDTASYTVVDTVDPTISYTLSPAAPNSNGWFRQDVVVDFTCADTGSGIKSCTGDTTLGEGADQSATGTATDFAGNTASDTVSDIDVDKTAPTVGFVGGPTAGGYYFGSVPGAPSCQGSDTLSGLASCTIDATLAGASVGIHSYTATATDAAGNTASTTVTYSVLAWQLKGFYSPIDMTGSNGPVWNTVKGGSTVPLKFEVFAASELTSTSAVQGFVVKGVTCPGANATTDDIELVTTGGTNLRYDTTGGQFIQNWQTPKRAGSCYSVTMTTLDGSSTTAGFILK